VGRLPLFVDLDVNQNFISLPGTISSVVVERTALIEEGSFNIDSQIAFHFGYKTAAENPTLYKRLITVLKDAINLRCESIHSSLIGGVIINTPSWIKDEGFKSIIHAALEFDVSAILVLDQERLRVELTRDLKDLVQDIKILSLPKSGGVVNKSSDLRTQTKNARIQEYFYGNAITKTTLYPHSIDINFNDLNIYQIGAPQLPDSLLPMGMKSEDNFTKVYKINPSTALLNHLLSVSHLEKIDNDSDKSLLMETNIAGYLVVTRVDMDKGMITVLSPQPKSLLKKIFLVSEVQFFDFK
jgi:polyribonucleotide 5'-hydroxyl-kinase